MDAQDYGKQVNFADGRECGEQVNFADGPDYGKQVNFADGRECGKQVNFADDGDCGKQVNSADGPDYGKQVNFADDRDCGKQVNSGDGRDCVKQVKLGKHYGKYSKFSIPPYVSNKLRGEEIRNTGYCFLSRKLNSKRPSSSVVYVTFNGVFSLIFFRAGSRKVRFISAILFFCEAGSINLGDATNLLI
ncbi:Uncharacterised protein [Klebsiella quasipneumoniae]|nr:Uncharacterised protein [Klebsiella quasipneumoniae]